MNERALSHASPSRDAHTTLDQLLQGVGNEFNLFPLSFAQERLSEKYWDTDAGWMLETNQPINQFMASMHGKLYKRYRLYQKAL